MDAGKYDFMTTGKRISLDIGTKIHLEIEGVAIALVFICYFFPYHNLLLIAAVLFGHSSLDRLLGFGLKYNQGFKFTHLGKIGKAK